MTVYYFITLSLALVLSKLILYKHFSRTLSCYLPQDAGEALQQVADVDAAAQAKSAVRWKLLHCHGVRADEGGRKNSITHVSSRHY